jgi:PTH1 family peptidyl-tRNA hydrolase
VDIDLVLGLGNPGLEFVWTRHNVGFRVVEETCRRRGPAVWMQRFLSEVAVIHAGRLAVVARPQTFMNRSGEAAVRLLEGLELTPERMLVVVDDIDLPLGALRLRRHGGAGTHNGLKDICEAVGNQFPRLRLGIRGACVDEDLADYVLGGFQSDEVERAEAAICRAADGIESILRVGVERAMNAVNSSSQHLWRQEQSAT